jgi:hypothetical protein
MGFDFVASKQVAFPVRTTRRMLGISASAYYAFCKRPTSTRRSDDSTIGPRSSVIRRPDKVPFRDALLARSGSLRSPTRRLMFHDSRHPLGRRARELD